MSVTDEIKAWFDEDQSQTGSELLCRLEAAHPDAGRVANVVEIAWRLAPGM